MRETQMRLHCCFVLEREIKAIDDRWYQQSARPTPSVVYTPRIQKPIHRKVKPLLLRANLKHFPFSSLLVDLTQECAAKRESPCLAELMSYTNGESHARLRALSVALAALRDHCTRSQLNYSAKNMAPLYMPTHKALRKHPDN